MKAKRIIAWTLTGIAALMVIFSGLMKFSQSQEVMKKMNELGVGPYVILLGVMEIVFAILFLIPQTRKVGFILLSCYFAGAIATDLSHGAPIFNAMIPLSLVWIAALIQDPSIFFGEKKLSLRQA